MRRRGVFLAAFHLDDEEGRAAFGRLVAEAGRTLSPVDERSER